MPAYHFPPTGYFNRIGPSQTLAQMGTYARAEQRALTVGPNIQVQTITPFLGAAEYSPGGAVIIERMRHLIERLQSTADPDEIWRLKAEISDLSGRWHRAWVVGPTTAPLGVPHAPMTPDGRRIWARVGLPIYAGKSKYMLMGAGVSADFQAIETELTDEMMRQVELERDPRKKARLIRELHARLFAETVLRFACNYGFINIEDAQGSDLPIILGILEALKGECGVWDDDMMGTGVVAAMGFLAWMKHSGRKDPSQIRGVIFGAGAGGYGVYRELIRHGLRPENILATDSGPEKDRSGRPYPMHLERADLADDTMKREMAEGISPDVTVDRFLEDADFMLNLGVRETLTRDPAWTERFTRRMADNFLFAPMTNPDPGITPDEVHAVREDGYYASGDQTKPNPFNNFDAFTQMALGVLLSKATWVGPEMTIAAAHGGLAVAELGPPEWLRRRLPKWRQEFGRGWLVPHPEDTRLILHEARAIALAAARHGYSSALPRSFTDADLRKFEEELDPELRFRKDLADDMRVHSEQRGRVYLQRRFGDRYDPVSLRKGDYPVFHVNPKINRREFEGIMTKMGTEPARWEPFALGEDQMRPNALSLVLKKILRAIQLKEKEESRVGVRRRKSEDSGVAVRDSKVAMKELELIVQIARVYPELGLALAVRRTRVRAENLAPRPTVFHRPAVLRVILEVFPRARADIQRIFPDVQIPESVQTGG